MMTPNTSFEPTRHAAARFSAQTLTDSFLFFNRHTLKFSNVANWPL
jgi:hypothetical protein